MTGILGSDKMLRKLILSKDHQYFIFLICFSGQLGRGGWERKAIRLKRRRENKHMHFLEKN